MGKKQEPQNTPNRQYEQENKRAEALVKELESPLGAQKLGDEAYETAKKDLAKCHDHKCS